MMLDDLSGQGEWCSGTGAEGSGSQGIECPFPLGCPSELKMELLQGWMPAVAKTVPAIDGVRPGVILAQ